MMRQEGFIAQFICTLLRQHRALAGLAFVNNTNLIVNDPSNTTQAVIEKMQKLLTMWHGLLCATSGELVPEKCFWYMIDFKWQNQQWRYKTTAELKGQISITLNQTNCIMIPRLKTFEAR